MVVTMDIKCKGAMDCATNIASSFLDSKKPPRGSDPVLDWASVFQDVRDMPVLSCQWLEERGRFEVEIAEFSPDTIIQKIVERKNYWSSLYYVLRIKKDDMDSNMGSD